MTTPRLHRREQFTEIPPIFESHRDRWFGQDGCWIWQGKVTAHGYGQVNYRATTGKQYQTPAHRMAYIIFVGDIPNGLTIDHLCRNRTCWRPSHLEAVTYQENVLRGDGVAAKNASKMYCRKGHELGASNVQQADAARGWRTCRECNREHAREQRRIIAEAAEAVGLPTNRYVSSYGTSRRAALAVIHGEA